MFFGIALVAFPLIALCVRGLLLAWERLRSPRPTGDEVADALALIRRVHPDADVLHLGVASVHRSAGSLYLEARPRDSLSIGDVYVTWVVSLPEGRVSSYRSRVGAEVDETIP